MTSVESGPPIAARTAAGASWMIATRLVARVLDFAALLVLARLLTPQDFGLVALAMSLIYIVEAVLELPLNQVLVQLDRITPAHLDTAFTLGLLRALFVAAALAAMAVPFSRIYDDPRLLPLILTLSLAPAARGIISPALAIYSKEGSFSRDFVLETGGKVIATILSITLAVMTDSYWALAAGTVCSPVVMVIISYVVAPTRVRLGLSEWRMFAGYMSWTTGAQILSALNWQIDRLMIGRSLSTTTVGRYSMASDLSYMPEQILLKPMARPIMSAFVKVRSDPDRLRNAYSRVNRTIATLTLPLIVAIGVLATPLLRVALGEKWIATGPLLSILALAGVGSMLAASFTSLTIAIGKPNNLLKRNLAEAAVKLPILIIGIPLLGVTGALLARGASMAAVAFASLFLVRRAIGSGIVAQLTDLWRPTTAALPMAILYFLALPLLAEEGGLTLTLMTGVVGLTGIVAYGGILLLLALVLGPGTGTPEETALRLLKRVLRRSAPNMGGT